MGSLKTDGYRNELNSFAGFVGCSIHGGRHTFITNAARKTSTWGSLRDVQILAGHTNLRTMQRYIEANPEAHVRIVDLI
jgi:integrase